MYTISALTIAALAARGVTALSSRQIFEIPNSTFVENIAIRSDASLLLSTFDHGRLYVLDPKSSNPSPEEFVELPGATGLTGIAEVGPNRFAVTASIANKTSYSFANMSVCVVDFGCSSRKHRDAAAHRAPTVRTVTNIPQAKCLSGMAALPATSHVVLSAEFFTGSIYRTDTRTGAADIVFQDDALGPAPGSVVPLGANGIKIHDGHLYFANSARGTFGRVPIAVDGSRAGDVEVLATLQRNASATAWDDFVMDLQGFAYVALHLVALERIAPGGEQVTLLGGDNGTVLKSTTLVAITADEKTLYITTGGSTGNGVAYGEQIVEVDL
jgi:hypothetical protein